MFIEHFHINEFLYTFQMNICENSEEKDNCTEREFREINDWTEKSKFDRILLYHITGPIGMLRVRPIKSPVLSLFSDMSYFRPVLNNLRDFVAHLA